MFQKSPSVNLSLSLYLSVSISNSLSLSFSGSLTLSHTFIALRRNKNSLNYKPQVFFDNILRVEKWLNY